MDGDVCAGICLVVTGIVKRDPSPRTKRDSLASVAKTTGSFVF